MRKPCPVCLSFASAGNLHVLVVLPPCMLAISRQPRGGEPCFATHQYCCIGLCRGFHAFREREFGRVVRPPFFELPPSARRRDSTCLTYTSLLVSVYITHTIYTHIPLAVCLVLFSPALPPTREDAGGAPGPRQARRAGLPVQHASHEPAGRAAAFLPEAGWSPPPVIV